MSTTVRVRHPDRARARTTRPPPPLTTHTPPQLLCLAPLGSVCPFLDTDTDPHAGAATVDADGEFANFVSACACHPVHPVLAFGFGDGACGCGCGWGWVRALTPSTPPPTRHNGSVALLSAPPRPHPCAGGACGRGQGVRERAPSGRRQRGGGVGGVEGEWVWGGARAHTRAHTHAHTPTWQHGKQGTARSSAITALLFPDSRDTLVSGTASGTLWLWSLASLQTVSR